MSDEATTLEVQDAVFPISIGPVIMAVEVVAAPAVSVSFESTKPVVTIGSPVINLELVSGDTVLEVSEIRPASALVYSGTMSQLFLAAEDIGGHRAVSLDGDGRVIAADAPGNDFAIGLIRDSVQAGATAEVHLLGKVNGFSGLDPGTAYFVGAGGVLTSTPPTTGVSQVIGRAYSPTELIVQPSDPILL